MRRRGRAARATAYDFFSGLELVVLEGLDSVLAVESDAGFSVLDSLAASFLSDFFSESFPPLPELA